MKDQGKYVDLAHQLMPQILLFSGHSKVFFKHSSAIASLLHMFIHHLSLLPGATHHLLFFGVVLNCLLHGPAVFVSHSIEFLFFASFFLSLSNDISTTDDNMSKQKDEESSSS